MRRLITEADVRANRHSGKIDITRDTLITPAARDLARRLGVALAAVPTAAEQDTTNGRPVDPTSADRFVALGADHGGYALKESLTDFLTQLGYSVHDVGCRNKEVADYPVFASLVANAVAAGDASFGIMIDGAGIGSAMVANKIAGVRAALCYDVTTAANAREHNNANVLTLGGTLIGTRLAREIVRTFLTTPFAGGRHQRRVSMIDALDGP
jgi:ribose 5-phosphate isomerase B